LSENVEDIFFALQSFEVQILRYTWFYLKNVLPTKKCLSKLE
jgi:hypothetical protein